MKKEKIGGGMTWCIWSVHMKMDEKGGAREKEVMGNVSTG
jgi:hypothetical protein